MLRDVDLFRNFKRWLVTTPNDLLDLLIPVADPASFNPVERYKNLVSVIDSHFNLFVYFEGQVQPVLPAVMVKITDVSVNECFASYLVEFVTYFQVVSPPDCKDDRVIVKNTPEDILWFKNAVCDALDCLVECCFDDLRGAVFDGEVWPFGANVSVLDSKHGELKSGNSEVLYFSSFYRLDDNMSRC